MGLTFQHLEIYSKESWILALDYGDSKRTKDLQDRPKSPSAYHAKKDCPHRDEPERRSVYAPEGMGQILTQQDLV